MESDELAKPKNVPEDFDDDELEDDLDDLFEEQDDAERPVNEAPSESCSTSSQ